MKVEEKIHHLRDYVYQMLGLVHKSEYYKEHGKFLSRYIAGFVDRIFELFEDIAYLAFDPLHIINIVQSFARGIFLHPIQTFKAVATMVIQKYTTAYGLGALTADAFILAISSAAVARVGAAVAGAQKSALAAEVVEESAVVGGKAARVAKEAVSKFGEYEDVFHKICKNPHEVIRQAHSTLKTGTHSGIISEVKSVFGL